MFLISCNIFAFRVTICVSVSNESGKYKNRAKQWLFRLFFWHDLVFFNDMSLCEAWGYLATLFLSCFGLFQAVGSQPEQPEQPEQPNSRAEQEKRNGLFGAKTIASNDQNTLPGLS